MSAAPRRDNGLRAESYSRLSEIGTHLVDGLLARLRAEGIAAHITPTPGRRGPYGETLLPTSPSDGVWVDSARANEAAGILQAYLETAEEDLAWAGIVATFERDDPQGADVVPRWPAAEDVDDDRPLTDDDSGVAGSPAAGPARAPRAAVPGDLEEHYEPPPPPPLPQPDTVNRVAWTAALGGPTVLLLATLIGLELPRWVGGLAVLAFVGGFLTLVARMQDRPPTDSGPDDGAVV